MLRLRQGARASSLSPCNISRLYMTQNVREYTLFRGDGEHRVKHVVPDLRSDTEAELEVWIVQQLPLMRQRGINLLL